MEIERKVRMECSVDHHTVSIAVNTSDRDGNEAELVSEIMSRLEQ